MPKYVGFRPQFTPISLEEYMKVPTMLQQEFDVYEDKYNENLDKLAALEAMLDNSIPDYLQGYKDNLNNAADMLSGKTGNLNTLRQQTNAARQFYREYVPRLTNAYTQRQAALKAQQDLQLKDPSAIITKVGNMRSFLDDPNQDWHALSGDKIYTDMIKAGQMSAADISSNDITKAKGAAGYLSQITRTGYTLAEQRQYANLVNRALNGDTEADAILKNTNIYAQPYQVLSKYIADNKFNLFDEADRQYITDRALSGQLMGMTGNTNEKLISDKIWDSNQEFNNWKRKMAYKAAQEVAAKNTIDVLERRNPEFMNTKEQQKNKKIIDEFKEVYKQIQADPSILNQKEPVQRTVKTTNISQAIAKNQRGLNNPMMNTYNPTQEYKYNPNYKQEKARYDLKQKFEKLSKKVSDIYPNAEFKIELVSNEVDKPFTIPGLGQFSNKVTQLSLKDNVDDLLTNLGEMRSGFNYNVTPAEMKAMTQMLYTNANLDGNAKQYNKYILDDEGNLIKNKDLQKDKVNEAVKDGKVVLYIGSDLKHHFDWNGKTYTVLEEGLDAEIGSQYFGDKQGQRNLRGAVKEGEYEYFNDGIYNFANTYVRRTRSRVPAQGQTSSSFDNNEIE